MSRRPLFFVTGVFHLIGMGGIGIYNLLNENGRLEEMFSFAQWIPIISILLIYSFSTVGYVSMVFMLTPELFPSYARAIGCGLVGVFDNLSLSLSVKMIPTLCPNAASIFQKYIKVIQNACSTPINPPSVDLKPIQISTLIFCSATTPELPHPYYTYKKVLAATKCSRSSDFYRSL